MVCTVRLAPLARFIGLSQAQDHQLQDISKSFLSAVLYRVRWLVIVGRVPRTVMMLHAVPHPARPKSFRVVFTSPTRERTNASGVGECASFHAKESRPKVKSKLAAGALTGVGRSDLTTGNYAVVWLTRMKAQDQNCCCSLALVDKPGSGIVCAQYPHRMAAALELLSGCRRESAKGFLKPLPAAFWLQSGCIPEGSRRPCTFVRAFNAHQRQHAESSFIPLSHRAWIHAHYPFLRS